MEVERIGCIEEFEVKGLTPFTQFIRIHRDDEGSTNMIEVDNIKLMKNDFDAVKAVLEEEEE